MSNKQCHDYFLFYRISVFLIFAGLISSLYLFYSHVKNHTDISHQSFCAISRAINCDTVSQSSFSIFLGLPLSLWGAAGYLFILVFLFSEVMRRETIQKGWAFLVVISAFFSCMSVVLAFVSFYIIRSYCIVCMLTYAVNLFLFLTAWMARSRFDGEQPFHVCMKKDIKCFYGNKPVIVMFSVFFVALLCMRFFMPQYWNLIPSDELSETLETGVTDEGDPWIGAEKPVLTIYEYTDYMCFQCMKMHFYLRKLVSANAGKIRLVHINYPMDKEFNPLVVTDDLHVGAGKLALLSEYASKRDDFWKINDSLFELGRQKGSIEYKKISVQTGLEVRDVYLAVNQEYYKKMLAFDIKRGMKKRIMATPSYIINDIVYTGIIPPDIFREAGI